MQKIMLSIPTPCHEDWSKMTPTEQGRFCSSCKKEVIDFSMMNDAEMFNYLSSLKKNNFCCSARPEQLDRPIEKAKAPAKPLPWYWSYFILFLLLFSRSAVKAQTIKGKMAYTPSQTDTPVVVVGGYAMKRHDLSGNKIKKGEMVCVEPSIKTDTIKPPLNIPINKEPENSTIIIAGGAMSITQDSEPLYIIDGTPVSNGLSHINPRDIESIDVLKDVSSAAIYGGANRGVVIIKTKKKTLKQTIKELPQKIVNLFADPLTVYPNPVVRGEGFSILMKQTGNYIIEVIDMEGAALLQKEITVDIKDRTEKLMTDANWTAGVYIVRLLSNGQLKGAVRLVVE